MRQAVSRVVVSIIVREKTQLVNLSKYLICKIYVEETCSIPALLCGKSNNSD